MTLPIIGTDCDITLMHPDVNGGDPYGFILTPDPNHGRSGVSVQREVSSDGEISIYLFFTVMLADDLLNPNGAEHTDSRATMYSMLLDFLAQTSQLCISTMMGTWLGIGSYGHSATELHLINGSMISIKLSNITTYHPPQDEDLVLDSIWWDDTPGEDALTWATSLWR